MNKPIKMRQRFRGFLPVIVDVETAGVNPKTDALLEVSAVITEMLPDGTLHAKKTLHEHVLPFEGANLCPKSLAFNKIIPDHPLRFAVPEQQALESIFKAIKEEVKAQRCSRAILVGHNAWFDLLFLKEATERCTLNSPFHSFSSLDTASLSALVFGQTVLAKGMECAGIDFDAKEAHSAIYDAEKTAELFCLMVNKHPISIPE